LVAKKRKEVQNPFWPRIISGGVMGVSPNLKKSPMSGGLRGLIISILKILVSCVNQVISLRSYLD
jgi:hypothetical protein